MLESLGNPAGWPPHHRLPADGSAPVVCVVGLGYIGLPTASMLAQRGYRVHGVDIRPDVVRTINRGEVHIHEPQLPELVRRVVAAGRLAASSSPCVADVFILCVPTPVAEDRRPDLSYVEQAARAIRGFVRAGSLVILESTSPPGTTADVVVRAAIPDELTVGQDVFVAYCPERVLPGRILVEAIENDRLVGGVTPRCTQRAKQFYESFVRGQVYPTSAVTAEITKLAENAFRDTNIAFANELSMLAARFGVDAFEIIELANKHPRVNILTPGPGVGGHCISVDPWFLVHGAPEETALIRAARQVNDRKPQFVVETIEELARAHGVTTIGCLGLTYKADVDDIRESPSLEIVRQLRRRRCGRVLACDPYLTAESFREFPLAELAALLARAEMLVLLTDHQQFRSLPAETLAGKVLLDTRGAWRTQTHCGQGGATQRVGESPSSVSRAA